MAGNEIHEYVSRDPEKKNSLKITGDINTDLISPLVDKIMKINDYANKIGGKIRKLKEIANLSTAKEQKEIDDYLNNKIGELNSILSGDDEGIKLKKLNNLNPSDLSKIILTMKTKEPSNKTILNKILGGSSYVETGRNYLNRNRDALKEIK